MTLDSNILRKIIIELNLVAPEHLDRAAFRAEEKGFSMMDELIAMGVVSKEELYSRVADKLGVPYIDILNYVIDSQTLTLFPVNFAVENLVCPLFLLEGTVTVGMADPTNLLVIDRIRARTGYEAEPCLCSENDLKQAIEQNYSGGISGDGQEGNGLPALAGLFSGTPVSRLVELILTQAVRDKASDIHIEPEEKKLRIRFRVDGILHEIPAPPKSLESAEISRIKIMASMDIATRRIPQDGHFRINVDGKEVDTRVSTVPTIYGENVVIRVLASSAEIMDFEEQGLSPEEIARFEEMISHPWGMVLATGPTGSGKTTMLYSALARVNSIEKNIVTIEDPVEIRLPLIRQIEVFAQVGLNFANGLRSIVRQDPDIIMVGEIRDPETAAIAVQAALTGHMVFSTLHTNDAAGAITRMVDMGIEPFLLSGSLTGVVAQRLIRKLCPKCREEYRPGKELLRSLGIDDGKENIFYRSRGCSNCKRMGYKGRVGIFEFLRVSDSIKEAIIKRESSTTIKRIGCEEGMKELKEDGLSKAMQGITSIEEVARVAEMGGNMQASAAYSEEALTVEPQKAEPREKTLNLDDYKKKITNWMAGR